VHLLGREPSAKPAAKMSRTEVAMMKAQAELQARMAQIRPPEPGREPAGEWWPGVILRYDSRTMTGTISFVSGPGRIDRPFSAASLLRHGPTTFSPGQSVEAHIVKRPDGCHELAGDGDAATGPPSHQDVCSSIRINFATC
jgi:hypothetical protein